MNDKEHPLDARPQRPTRNSQSESEKNSVENRHDLTTREEDHRTEAASRACKSHTPFLREQAVGARRKTHHMSGTLKKKRESKSSEKKKKGKQFWSPFRFRGTFSGQLRTSTKEQTVESCSNNDSGATGCICTGYRKTDESKTLPSNDALSTPPDGMTVIKGPRLSEVVPITVNIEPGDRKPSVSTFQSQDRNTRTRSSTRNQGRRRIERPAWDSPSHSAIATNTPGNTRTQRRPLIDFSLFDPNMYPTEDPDQILWDERQQEMREGVLVQSQPRRPSAGGTRLAVAPPSERHDVARVTPPRSEVPLVEMIEIEIVLARCLAISATDSTVANQPTNPGGPIALPDSSGSDQSGGYPLISNVLPAPIIRINQQPRIDPNAQSRGNYTSVEYPDSSNPHPPPIPHRVHTQVDYVHCLVPDLHSIHNSGFYWAVMDRYGAEKLLENKPEGTFLLRDSAQEEFLFSVSFRRYGRTLHARIEQWNHKFSFDSHDPGVFATPTVCGLLKHYKDPSCCMFFEPMLTIPLNRKDPFSLQELSRSVACSHTTYDGVDLLPLPNKLKEYLKYYHYKQKVRVRRFERSSGTDIHVVNLV